MRTHEKHVFVVVDENITVDISSRRFDGITNGFSVITRNELERPDRRIGFQNVVSLRYNVVFKVYVHIKLAVKLSYARRISIVKTRIVRTRTRRSNAVIGFAPVHKIFGNPAWHGLRHVVR